MSGTLSEEFAEFATELRFEHLPAAVVERVRLHALDIVGVCLLGSSMDFAGGLATTVGQLGGGAAQSTLIGADGVKLPAPLAALFNGGLAHGTEYDDTYPPGRWHGSAPVVPPALAVAEALHRDGAEFVTAVAAGLEVGCRLTKAAPGLIRNGFHSTATAGAIVATLAVGRLMRLDAKQMAGAVGLAGGFAGGSTEFLHDPASWTKRIQVGYAGHAAIVAATAAANGFVGPRTILEGERGYFRSHAGEGGFDLEGITKELGSRWELLRLCAKRYPCDHVIHSYLDCVLELRESLQPSEIAAVERVECVVHPLVVPIALEPRDLRYRPEDGWAARWSMPFGVAVALLDGAVGVDSYRDVRLGDPAVVAVMDKVTYSTDSSLPFPESYPARVRLHLSGGEVREQAVRDVKGSPENPMTEEAYEYKFVDNARRRLSSGAVDQLLATLRDLPTVADMADVAALAA